MSMIKARKGSGYKVRGYEDERTKKKKEKKERICTWERGGEKIESKIAEEPWDGIEAMWVVCGLYLACSSFSEYLVVVRQDSRTRSSSTVDIQTGTYYPLNKHVSRNNQQISLILHWHIQIMWVCPLWWSILSRKRGSTQSVHTCFHLSTKRPPSTDLIGFSHRTIPMSVSF